MKKLTIKLNLDERKYDALHTFSTQKGIDIDAEFVAYFEKMYKKIVPKAVREYIEGTTLSTVSDRFPKKRLSTMTHSFSRNRSPKPSQIRSQTPVVSGRNIFKLFRISKTHQNLSNRCLFRMQDKAVVPLRVSTASQTRTVCGFSGFKKWYYFLNGSTTLPPTIS